MLPEQVKLTLSKTLGAAVFAEFGLFSHCYGSYLHNKSHVPTTFFNIMYKTIIYYFSHFTRHQLVE